MALKVAIIEDSRELAVSIKKHLEQHNMQVIGMCHSGIDALKMIEEVQFDLLLLDLILPHIDGITLLKEHIPKSHSYKIICLSAFGKDSVLSEAMNSGADYFILKPINFDNFVNRINQICGIDTQEMTINRLVQLGFKMKHKGTKYIQDALEILEVRNETHHNNKIHLTIDLYPKIAEKNDIRDANVERSIRHAIERAWDNGLKEQFQKRGKINRPTSGELLKFLLEEKHD
ncbi:response regulator [Macrococcoides caseolyticum]|uniref:response regulator n=1 Tax=Macrococcoides caseolyticum TaxID=69966 RepID=UPI001F444B94|nr:response regulator [Macrococcus caseolyticus]MCE4956081.1 response regulator [Macrococcus caseolyticus]